MPTSSHIFYIPLVLLIGLVLGLFMGRRSAFLQQQEDERRKKREAERKARAAATATAPKEPPSP